MSSTRSFTVEIGGREIKEDVIADEKKAIYRANVDALTYFHSEVESQFNVVVTIDDLHTFFPGLNLGTRTMDLILQKNAPYAETYYIYDMYHDQSFFSREEYRIYRRYMDVYNKQRQLYTQKIPEFDIYLQKNMRQELLDGKEMVFFVEIHLEVVFLLYRKKEHMVESQKNIETQKNIGNPINENE